MKARPRKGKLAATVKVGEKGQIVIPKAMRDLLQIEPGDTLLVLADKKRGMAISNDTIVFDRFTDILSNDKEASDE
ncbi:MAG: AbrB/MazE/SpoVT family DNA-binding domain-containing protein [Oscillospiraceae bacterium]|jgi:AbrB family looped-hinge helix DNA binding protein|nr:AbrB/MazE/SpoVT family DNA-binding domain-containing protein [Oscillospiraceae bacterium]MDD3261924.1 AbrB/MazE/SpoVT family DNA-binding domain-containing protein [Oscillospiraceae bacterium]